MKNELINHIKEKLADHELDYRPGAWENFKKKAEKPHETIILWRRMASIAAVLIFAILFFLINRQSPESKKDTHLKLFTTTDNRKLTVKGQKTITQKRLFYTYKNKPVKLIADTPFRAVALSNINGVTIFDQDSIHHLTNHELLAVTPIIKPAHVDMPADMDKHPMATKKNQPIGRDRWRLSLSMGQARSYGENNQFGMGASVSYQISNKIELSSGFYFNQLGAKKDISRRPMSYDIGKYLVNVRSNLAGLEIPLEIKYKFTNSLYSKVGFSAYSITSQQQSLLFNEEKTEVKNYVDASGTAYSETISFTEAQVIQVPKARLSDTKFVGLYNISVGFAPRMFNKQKLAFEPYLKIPVDGFSNYKINLSQIGLKINVGL